MIITSLKAVNILKYEKLELTDLPEKGVIAISGANESGKSTIGETVCYALFGRTWSLGDGDLSKLIRWGEHQGSAKITFKTNTDKHYEVARFMDKDGNIGARMNFIDEVSHPLARGDAAVTKLVCQILGYNANEFLETFYLAQREITTPHPHSFVVKTMAGITPLEISMADFENQIKDKNQKINEIQEKIEQVTNDIHELSIDQTLLTTLKVQRHGALVSEDEGQEHQKVLQKSLTEYHRIYDETVVLKGKKINARIFAFLGFFLTSFFAIIWFTKAAPIDTEILKPVYHYGEQFWHFLVDKIGFWEKIHVSWVLYFAMGCGFFTLIFKIRSILLQGYLHNLADDASILKKALNESIFVTPEPESLLYKEVANEKIMDDQASNYLLSPVLKETIESEGLKIKAVETLPEEATKLVSKMSQWLQKRVEGHNQNGAQLDQAIGVEEERLAQNKRLESLSLELNDKISANKTAIQTRELAIDLLSKAIRHLGHNFNRDIRDKVSGILPKFTEGRYEHLQIEKDLSVSVFSSEKRDFIGLDEISSGTSRQIMLSLRLALAQSLVQRMSSGLQFLFLDEPFAFFDAERTRLTLKMLPNLGGDLNQIWIISQEFLDSHQDLLAKQLNCGRDLTMIEA